MNKIRAILSADLGKVVLPVIATAALAITSGTLFNLMTRLGWPDWQAALLPISLDVLAGYGVNLWVSAKKNEASKRWGRGVALACLVVSITGNALEHVFTALHYDPPSRVIAALAITFGAIPPVSFFVSVHLYAMATGALVKRRAAGPSPSPTDGSAEPGRKRPAPATKLRAVASSDSELVMNAIDAGDRLRARGEKVNRVTLKSELGRGVSNNTIARLGLVDHAKGQVDGVASTV